MKSLGCLFFVFQCLVVGFVFSNETPTNKTDKGCGAVDILFLLDTSSSVWPKDFQRQLNFTADVISQMDVGPGPTQTRVGVVTVGQRFYLQFYLKSFLNYPLSTMKRAVHSIRHRSSRRTNTALALKFATTYMFKSYYGGRENATHVIIAITDGLSHDPVRTKQEAQTAKDKGIQIFSIGVGHNVRQEELLNIGSKPASKYVFQVNDFNALYSIQSNLPRSSCDVMVPEPEPFIVEEDLYLTEGQSILFTCVTPKVNIADALRHPVRFFRDEDANVIAINDMSFSRRVNITLSSDINHFDIKRNFTVLITDITPDDAGVYYCLQNGLNASINVQINGSSEVTTSAPEMTTVPTEVEVMRKFLDMEKYYKQKDRQKQLRDLKKKWLSGKQAADNNVPLDYLMADDPRKICGGKDADIYFALDASSSIWPEDFKNQKEFVNDLVETFDFNNNRTRVGVLVYSSEIHPKVPLDFRWSKENTMRAVASINYTSGLTHTNEAIRFIRQYGFTDGNARENAAKIAIILTDGISRNPLATKNESALSRAAGITLFAIGVGKDIDKTELKRIANDPDDRYVFHVSSFSALASIRSIVALSACGVVPDEPSSLMSCGRDALADVIFVYDAAGLGARKSEMISTFVYDVTRQLETTPNKLRIGRMTDNCPINTNIGLGADLDRKLFSQIDFPGIESLIERLKTAFPNRVDSKNLAVVFVDDTTKDIEQATRFLKGDVNFHILVVAIGDLSVIRSARDLATRSDLSEYFVNVPTYLDLKSTEYELMQKLCFLITNQADYLRDQRVPSK